jgi:uncharacterized protein YlxP (DUF503 family)
VLISLCEITLRFPGVLSLKEKRSMLKSLLSRLRQRFNISVAEVGEQDKWQLSLIAVACVSADSAMAHQLTEQVLHFIERADNIEVVRVSRQIF